MNDFLKSVRNLNIFLIATLTIVIGSVVGILVWDLNRQNEDAIRINLAGRQGTLSQRIAKRALYIEREIERVGTPDVGALDTLKERTREWQKVHYALLNGDETLRVKATNSPEVQDVLADITPLLVTLVDAINEIVNSKGQLEVVRKALDVIEANELQYLLKMERVTKLYQREAEEKLYQLKNLIWILGSVMLGLIFLEFLVVIAPVIRRLNQSNQLLNEQNVNLDILNKDLQATEEELRSNLEHISFLQENLEQREKQYRSIVEEATDLIYELDGSGRFVFANVIMLTVSDYSREELYQRHYWDLVAANQKARLVEFYKAQRKSKIENTYFEFLMLSRTGQEIWVGQNARMFFDEQGWVTKVSVVARDISERKEAERKLSQERILLRTIIDNIPINIYAKNKHSEKILANRSEYEYLGAKSEEEILNRDDFALYPDDSARISIQEDQEVFNGKAIINRETLNTKTDGSQSWFLISKVPLRDDTGEITGLVGISIDITERKKAQEELAAKEKQYRLLSENSQDVVSLNALDGTFEYISPACVSLHGYTPEELVGRKGTDFIFDDDVKKIEATAPDIREKWTKGEAVEPMQFRLATKNRGLVWVENVMKPRFEDGVLVGFQSTLRDITFRKEYELALEQAKEKAENATSAKSQFLSMMSHEIRTPMNAIIGLTNLLIEEGPRPDQEENLHLLKFSGENLLTIINDVLDFSKIEAGKMELENVSFNLPELLHHHVQMLQGRANDKRIELKLDLDKAVTRFVNGDPVRLGQIINNLLSNAIKFTEKGKVQLTVKMVSDGMARFDVSDTGIGIPAAKLDSIFDSFTQASADTTRKFGGTGLGLSITRRLLAMMNTDITVSSEPGKGSVFSFTFPLEKGHDFLSEEIVTTKKSSQHKLLAGKVLLAEDNRVNQVVAFNFLRKWGIEMDVAADGHQVIDMIQSKAYDLVLMDLQMPLMDGYEAARQIRSLNDHYFKQLPIVALTAEAMTEIKDAALQAGMNDYVTKPFQPDELFGILAKHLNKGDKASYLLSQNLSRYTDDDPEYKRELVGMLLANLDELIAAVPTTIETKDVSIFKKAIHKMKTTLSILGDAELERVISQLSTSFGAMDTEGVEPDRALRDRFSELCATNRQRLEAAAS